MFNSAHDGIMLYFSADEEVNDNISQPSSELQPDSISISTNSNESAWDADPVLSREAEQNRRVERTICEITKLSFDEATLFDF